MNMSTLLKTPSGKVAQAPLQCLANPPARILFVDDEICIRRVSAEVLTSSGYQVLAVEDGAIAWEALQVNNYDLVITDHNMPKLTGVELLNKMHAARMALPVILVTGALPTEQLKRHPWLQIDATLLKPFTIEELLGTVTNVLRATVSAREPIEPPPNWQSQPAAGGLRLC
jgi:two-component system chemotaxis response regulator CheY